MMLEYKKSESTECPKLLDTTSSKRVVYMRKNVIEKQREDADGNAQTYYEYDEAKLTKAEYEEYRKNPDSADVGELREQVNLLTECLLEMSQILYR